MYQIDFNPRSREGSDLLCAKVYDTAKISIHAPVKGATRPTGVHPTATPNFNPRSREGSDPDRRPSHSDAQFQSTLP